MTSTMKPLVLLSGGMDSSVLLAEVLHKRVGLENRANVKALSVFYGQRHEKELEAARLIAAFYGVPHEIISVPDGILRSPHSSQTSETPVPHGHYAEENMKATVVPNRNMFLISIAVARAIAEGYTGVYYAAHAGDHAIYPDCRPAFVLNMQKAIESCDWTPPMLVAPFLLESKADIVRRGLDLLVPFERTWTCYEGRDLACGRCGTCVERLEAFAIAGAEDPLRYADREFWRSAGRK